MNKFLQGCVLSLLTWPHCLCPLRVNASKILWSCTFLKTWRIWLNSYTFPGTSEPFNRYLMNEWELFGVSESSAIFIHCIFELHRLHSWLFTQAVMNIICFLLQMPSPSFPNLYVPRRWKLCQGIHFLSTIVTFNQDQVLAEMENTKAKVLALLLPPWWLFFSLPVATALASCSSSSMHAPKCSSWYSLIPPGQGLAIALVSTSSGQLYHPLLVTILQKPPLVAASQVLSLSEPSASS